MKKLFLITILSLSLLLAGGSVFIKTSVNLRSKASLDGDILGSIEKGKTVKYDSAIASYYFIEVIKGDSKKTTSDHVGKKGWMWSGRVKNGSVIVEGCTLRSSPEYKNNGTGKDSADDPNFIAKVKKGATIKILKTIISWYKIDGSYFSAIGTK